MPDSTQPGTSEPRILDEIRGYGAGKAAQRSKQETVVCSHKGKEPEEKTASLKWRIPHKKTNSEKKNVVRILMFNRSAWSTASGCMMEKK